MTGLTRATVSGAVADLENDGMIAEVGVGPSKSGKPPILLKFVDEARCLIGLDLAENEFRGAIVNLRGEIKHRLNWPINGGDVSGTLASIDALIDRLRRLSTSPLLGIGIGAPGLIDSQHGVVRYAAKLDWREIRLGEMLARKHGLPVHIANDCQAAALAEFTFGNGNGHEPNLIVIKASQGIGAGIVLNRQLFCGDRFGAGELGHLVINEGGDPCRCGHRGCLETVVGSESILRAARGIAAGDPGSLLHRFAGAPERIDIDAVARALEAGDGTLRSMVAEAGRILGIALANLVGILNVHRLILAGSLTRLGPALLDPVRREIGRRSLSALADETVVAVSGLGEDIVILGAAALLLNNELKLP
ncbi:MAG: Glucokinase [Candidatus Aminicenantes bacterium ADurb.Bin147]|nr:MAG: Glucokinase [Candidatus Aminicenantes bacterium ADurb.Bin147]